MTITANKVLDCKGMACPMPIVKTKKAIETITPGEVLEMQATDKGSLADIQAWAKSTGNTYLGTETEGNVLRHFIRKGGAQEEAGTAVPVLELVKFQEKVESGQSLQIVDVRESDEFAEGHIEGAIHLPLGEIENRYGELNKDTEYYVICRSGKRSEMATQQLAKLGFKNLINVVPGMGEYKGHIVQK